MVDNRKISICIPTWERVEMTIDSFKNVYDDERVSEIVIVDDASSQETYDKLKEICDLLPKVKLYRNEKNVNCYENKYISISHSTNDWCILFDSDNVLNKEYIDSIYRAKEWLPEVILAPVFARPHFDYTHLSGVLVTKGTISYRMSDNMFQTALNTCNYFVNKNEYLSVWDGSIDPVTSDTIYFNYCWVNSGRIISFVQGMEYIHNIHSGSHYQNNVARTPNGVHESILQKLRELK